MKSNRQLEMERDMWKGQFYELQAVNLKNHQELQKQVAELIAKGKPKEGQVRYNYDGQDDFEVYNGNNWVNFDNPNEVAK